jgi:energy-coupling factor transporter ATP-binding protein EcfA2
MIGGALSWLRRTAAAALRRREDLRAPAALAGLPRILLLGPTGAGKSTLVNAMLGAESAQAGAGAPVTAGLTWHTGPAWAVALGDTRGLETAEGAAQEARLSDALGALAPEERPHLAWIVLNAEAGRAHAGGGTPAALAAALRGAEIPALVVLTHAEPAEAAHARLRARVAEAIGDLPMIAVNTTPLRAGDGTVLIPRHGLDALRRATEERLP